MGASNWVYLDVTRVVHETNAAFLVEIDGERLWLPKSQVADADDYEVGDEDVEISVTEFIANKLGVK